MQSINNTNYISFTRVVVREMSSTAALMKLLLPIEVHVTTAALSPPLPARGRGSSILRASSHQPWPRSGLESTVEFEGVALKTGRVTCVPLYSARRCASTLYKLLKINLRLFLGVIHFEQFVESFLTVYSFNSS